MFRETLEASLLKIDLGPTGQALMHLRAPIRYPHAELPLHFAIWVAAAPEGATVTAPPDLDLRASVLPSEPMTLVCRATPETEEPFARIENAEVKALRLYSETAEAKRLLVQIQFSVRLRPEHLVELYRRLGSSFAVDVLPKPAVPERLFEDTSAPQPAARQRPRPRRPARAEVAAKAKPVRKRAAAGKR